MKERVPSSMTEKFDGVFPRMTKFKQLTFFGFGSHAADGSPAVPAGEQRRGGQGRANHCLSTEESCHRISVISHKDKRGPEGRSLRTQATRAKREKSLGSSTEKKDSKEKGVLTAFPTAALTRLDTDVCRGMSWKRKTQWTEEEITQVKQKE